MVISVIGGGEISNIGSIIVNDNNVLSGSVVTYLSFLEEWNGASY